MTVGFINPSRMFKTGWKTITIKVTVKRYRNETSNPNKVIHMVNPQTDPICVAKCSIKTIVSETIQQTSDRVCPVPTQTFNIGRMYLNSYGKRLREMRSLNRSLSFPDLFLSELRHILLSGIKW